MACGADLSPMVALYDGVPLGGLALRDEVSQGNLNYTMKFRHNIGKLGPQRGSPRGTCPYY